MQDRLEIGQRLRKQRESHGYTREQLVEIVDITPRFCYDLELGTKGMSVDTLCQLHKALNVSTDYILFGSEDKEEGADLELITSLYLSCPEEKRTYLRDIITNFLQAVR